MRPTGYMTIPQYKCHKVVRAFKIARIDSAGQTNYLIAADDKITPIPITKENLDLKNPSVGDYYVLYDDGYTSFSPPKAFEDGYDLVKADAEGVNDISSLSRVPDPSQAKEKPKLAEGESISKPLVEPSNPQLEEDKKKLEEDSKAVEADKAKLASEVPHFPSDKA